MTSAGPNGTDTGTTNGDPGRSAEELQLSIRGVRTREGDEPGELVVEMDTTRGVIETHLHPCEGKGGCVIFVGGAAGGIEGPASRVYTRLSRELVAHGITSLRLRYRQPGEFEECVVDVLAACSFLKGIGAEQTVVVGHSFGGAVAIKVGELGGLVTAVAALSSQRFGTGSVETLAKPLLLIHGSRDDILDRAASDDIYERAVQPKRLVVLDGAGHGLLEAAEEVHDLLHEFIIRQVGEAVGEG